MAEPAQSEYTPDFVFPPGETLAEELEVRGMTPSELASQMNYPIDVITGIISGEGEITPEVALRLERVLGISATFWNNYERGYRESLARKTGPLTANV